MNKLSFVKYHGAGNDFVLIDLTESSFLGDSAALARNLCDRRHGIGADGLLLLESSQIADYRMHIFNADGSEPAMCGNGISCLAHYIFEQRPSQNEIKIETMHRILKCRKINDKIAVDLGVPSIVHWQVKLESASAYIVDTGVPHAVIFTEDLERIEVASEGAKIRFDARFAPHGVNVNFVSIRGNHELTLRTYERGVEGETLACGTGAAAAAFVAYKLKKTASSLSVFTRSSLAPTLHFSFLEKEQGEPAIEMIANPQKVFEGVVSNFVKVSSF